MVVADSLPGGIYPWAALEIIRRVQGPDGMSTRTPTKRFGMRCAGCYCNPVVQPWPLVLLSEGATLSEDVQGWQNLGNDD